VLGLTPSICTPQRHTTTVAHECVHYYVKVVLRNEHAVVPVVVVTRHHFLQFAKIITHSSTDDTWLQLYVSTIILHTACVAFIEEISVLIWVVMNLFWYSYVHREVVGHRR